MDMGAIGRLLRRVGRYSCVIVSVWRMDSHDGRCWGDCFYVVYSCWVMLSLLHAETDCGRASFVSWRLDGVE